MSQVMNPSQPADRASATVAFIDLAGFTAIAEVHGDAAAVETLEIFERMVREAGVAAIPVSAFYRDDPERGFLRLCFAKEDATLDEAVERLAGFRTG